MQTPFAINYVADDADRGVASTKDDNTAISSSPVTPSLTILDQAACEGDVVDDVLFAQWHATADLNALKRAKSLVRRETQNLVAAAAVNAGCQQLSDTANSQASSPPDDNAACSEDEAEVSELRKLFRSLQTSVEANDDDVEEISTAATTNGDTSAHSLNVVQIDMTNLPETVPSVFAIRCVGVVESCVGELVLVRAASNTPALDLGSVLCTKDRHIIGVVNDTFGPVASPFYAVVTKVPLQPGEDVFVDCTNSTLLADEGSGQTFDYRNLAVEDEVKDEEDCE